MGIPLLLLGAAELVLRFAGGGFPTTLWVPDRIGERAVWRENDFYTYRYFPPPMARVSCIAHVDRPKPADAVRIVVLGESAALGDPMSDFGPPRMLQSILRHRYPGRRIEVINGAITAINSHVIREIARELSGLEPDAVILYIGNNEVIGPYGPGTVFSGFFSNDAWVRASVWASRFRLLQLARFAASVVLEGRMRTEFDGLDMFSQNPVAADDPRLNIVYRRFDRNLRAIVRSVHRARAQAVLCTVAVNRRDFPPVLSRNNPGLTAKELETWEEAFQKGRTGVEQEDWGRALTHFERAAELDPAHAELAWLTAMCVDQAGQPGAADRLYDLACEQDAFRFRADAALNRIVKEIAASQTDRLVFVDVDAHFRGDSAPSDADLFMDHVHFTLEGSYDLACLWADSLETLAAFQDRLPAPPPSFDEVKDQLLITPYIEMDFSRRILTRHSQPPFTSQWGHSNRMQRLLQRHAELEAAAWGMDLDATRRAYEFRMASSPDDPFLPLHWGRQLLEMNRTREAEEVVRRAMQRAPHRISVRLPMARLLAATGHPDDAAQVLLAGRRKHGYAAAGGTFQIVSTLLSNGQTDEALSFAQSVLLRIRRLDYRWRVRRAVAQLRYLAEQKTTAMDLMNRGRLPDAIPVWQKLMKIRNDMPEPLFWLGAWHTLRREFHFSEPLLTAAGQRWNRARHAYHLGLLRAAMGQTEEARIQLRIAADWAHDDLELVGSLAWVFQFHPNEALRDPDRARPLLQRAQESERIPSLPPRGSWLLRESRLP